MSEEMYDILVLGAGPGGYVAALKAAQMGARTALVEKAELGGTCLNNGCIPSKALLATAEMLHQTARAAEYGVKIAGGVTVDWPAVQKRKDKILRQLRGGIKSLLAGRNVTVLSGRGVLAGPGRIAVTDAKGAIQEVMANKTILAVGSEPARFAAWPDDRTRVCTSDEALHWKTLPESLLIVGGGVIGCEFACMMQALGVKVTVVEMMDRLLPEMDEELGPTLGTILKKRGVAIHLSTKVEALTLTDRVRAAVGADAVAAGGTRATLSGGVVIEASRVLVAVGRRAATANLGLETVGLATDRGFVRVNDRMETLETGIYCIGDTNGRCLLAHAASAQGMTAVHNALGGNESFHAPIPGAVYTFPEIGAAGMTTQEARAKQIPLAIGKFPVGYLGKSMAVGHTEGFTKVLRHRESGALLGVHMIGHNATECIAAAGALLHTSASAETLAEVVFAHPSMSETLKEAGEDALSMGLHLAPRKVLQVVG
jgi:dihydrolipoamide dehydrogenase